MQGKDTRIGEMTRTDRTSPRFWTRSACALLWLAALAPVQAEIELAGDTTGLHNCDLEAFAHLSGYTGNAFRSLREASVGVTFGQMLTGQVNHSSGGFDRIIGTPTVPLTMDTAVDPVFGINVIIYRGQTVMDGLGPDGFPSSRAIGNGALTVLYDADQTVIAFDVVGANRGTFTVQFFDRAGTLLGDPTVTGVTNGTYVFSSDVRNIAAITIDNTDFFGLAYDNFLLTPADPPPPSICQAGGPYEVTIENGLAEVPLSGFVAGADPDVDWNFVWATDCPNGVFDDPMSPTPVLYVEADVACRLDCTATLVVDEETYVVGCTAPVALVVGGQQTACPAGVTVECDGEGNLADLEGWWVEVETAHPDLPSDLGEIVWDCANTGSTAVSWDPPPGEGGDCGTPSTCETSFAIVDTTPPAFELEGTYFEFFDTECAGEVSFDPPAATATDACDDDVTVTVDAPESFPTGEITTVTYTATDACGNTSSTDVQIAVLHGTTVEVEVVATPAGPQGNGHAGGSQGSNGHSGANDDSTAGAVDAVVNVYDRAQGSCAHEETQDATASPESRAAAILAQCEPVATAATDEQGLVLLGLPPGKYVLVAAFDFDQDGTPDEFALQTIGRLKCGDWKTHTLRLTAFAASDP